MYFRSINNPAIKEANMAYCLLPAKQAVKNAFGDLLPWELIDLIVSYQTSVFAQTPTFSEKLTNREGRIRATGVQQGEVMAYHEGKDGLFTLLERALGPRSELRFQTIFPWLVLDKGSVVAKAGEHYYLSRQDDRRIYVGVKEKGIVTGRPPVSEIGWELGNEDVIGDKFVVCSSLHITIFQGGKILEKMELGLQSQVRWIDADTLLIDQPCEISTYSLREKRFVKQLPLEGFCLHSTLNSQRTHLFRVERLDEKALLKTYALPSFQEVGSIPVHSPNRISGDERIVALFYRFARSSEVHFWDTESGTMISKLPIYADRVQHFALHGTTLVYSISENDIYLHHF